MDIVLIIIVVAVVVVGFWLMMTYNGLVKSKNQVNEAWSDIDVQLKRRYDLIPNLIEAVKGYAKHENETFQQVTEARANAIKAEQSGDTKALGEAENVLAGTLKTLFAVAENYPELKANQNFLQLQDELSDTENKVQASRRFYNGNVRDFNTKIQVFPTNLIAGMFKFVAREFFEMENEEERIAPKVKF